MKRIRLISLLAAVLSLLVSCERDGLQLDFSVGPYGEETRRVLVLYGAGFNSLSRDIGSNIATLRENYLPGKGRDEDVVVLLSHQTTSSRNYGVDTQPALIRLYREHETAVMDTLKLWPAGTSCANAAMVTEVFNLVKELFPAAGYGAVMSSHATGWLPSGYFSNPKPYEGDDRNSGGIYWTAPRLRTFGQEYFNAGKQSEEIELKDLAAAIPYRLDYLLFDACLMATVEVAWELRDAASFLGFSPCEIPAAGMDYSHLAEYLLKGDLKGVCADYFARYEHDSVYGATITMVDCTRLEGLAGVCADLFEKYRAGILGLDGKKVQVYDRSAGGKYYYAFFDLKDLLREAGASESDLALLQEKLDEAIVYEAHTSSFIDVRLDRCCGLAMYLPAYPDYRKDKWHGTQFLDGFYKENVAWNKATSLVK